MMMGSEDLAGVLIVSILMICVTIIIVAHFFFIGKEGAWVNRMDADAEKALVAAVRAVTLDRDGLVIELANALELINDLIDRLPLASDEERETRDEITRALNSYRKRMTS